MILLKIPQILKQKTGASVKIHQYLTRVLTTRREVLPIWLFLFALWLIIFSIEPIDQRFTVSIKLLLAKSKHRVTNRGHESYMQVFYEHFKSLMVENDVPVPLMKTGTKSMFLSLQQASVELMKQTGIGNTRFECCINSCVCFGHPKYQSLLRCPECNQPRYEGMFNTNS